jgi:Na+/H+-dicarboxylate symporter
MKKFLSSTILWLAAAVALGIALGQLLPASAMRAVLSIKQISGQVIYFLVPLIIIGFVTPSIANLRSGATKLIGFAFALAYVSSIGAALFGIGLGYRLVPLLSIPAASPSEQPLPDILFTLNIPPVMPVMPALLLSVFIGLGTAWIRSDELGRLLKQFQEIVLHLVNRVLLPLLPVFVAANFCVLSYQGDLARLWIFLPVVGIVVAAHYCWLALLYGAASLYARRNGWQVLKHYGPAYVTALGTMSSAATLGVALDCARRSSLLRKEVTDFSIPLFANIHLCGSVLTEVFFVAVVSQLLYGQLPEPGTFVLFVLLLGVFAIGAPGVPGGTVLASLGLVISVLGFDEAGTAMLIAIFALQDSFGTACNITGDGALTLIVNTFSAPKKIQPGSAEYAKDSAGRNDSPSHSLPRRCGDVG